MRPLADTNPENPTDLRHIRQRIDAIDAQLLALLNERAACSQEVGCVKAQTSAPVFHPQREQALLQRLANANSGPLPEAHLMAIYREILSSSRALQHPLRIAFLGPEGTFSHMAGLEFFGSALAFTPQHHLANVFSAVESQRCDLGIVPLENSLNGTVGQTVDLFAAHEVFIQAEWFSRINLCLMSREPHLEQIRAVYSHAQPLGQCAAWLHQHLAQAEQYPVESTAAAAHKALQEAGSAAIGHKGLADRLGLTVLQEGIEDAGDNWTRFCVISATPNPAPTGDKTSVLFSLADRPGSLSAVLQLLAASGINLSKLESRPMRSERWKYIFFADLAADIRQTEYTTLRENLHKHCHTFRILGVYAQGTHTQRCI